MMAKKKFALRADQIKPLAKNRGGCFATDMITVEGGKVEQDAPRVLALWAHPDDTVWHNLRAWLFRTFRARGVQAFAESARRSGLAEAVQARLVEDLSEIVNNPPQGFDSRLAELYGIPNLRGVRQKADQVASADRRRD